MVENSVRFVRVDRLLIGVIWSNLENGIETIGDMIQNGDGIILPIGSMYAIYGNIYHQYTPNVSIYTSTMDPMGYIEQHKDVKELRMEMLGPSLGEILGMTCWIAAMGMSFMAWWHSGSSGVIRANRDTAASLATDLIFIEKVETTSSVQTLSAQERPPTVVATENAVIRLAASWLLWTKGWGGDQQLPWWRKQPSESPS